MYQKLTSVVCFNFIYCTFIFSQFSAFNPVDPWIPAWNNNEAVQLGFFPVTLTGANPNDGIDDTKAINDAIRIARDYRYACYFPAGEYLISETVEAMLPSYWNTTINKWSNNRTYPPTLIGDPDGVILKLTSDAPGFTITNPNDTTIMPLITLWAQPTSFCQGINGRPNNTDLENYIVSTEPDQECQGIAFNLTMRNFTIDLNGHNNAVGIRCAGAQGSTLEHITIHAEGAYAGIQNGFGEGGGMFDISVFGGLYGQVVTDAEQGYNFSIAGGQFIDQEIAVFRGESWAPTTFTGLYIEKDTPQLFSEITDGLGHPNLETAEGGLPYFRGISMIDVIINIKNNGTSLDAPFTLWKNNNIFLKNIFVKGVSTIISWGNINRLVANNANEYTHIESYSHANESGWMNYPTSVIQGVENFEDLHIGADGQDPFYVIDSQKHIWNNRPWFDNGFTDPNVHIIPPQNGNDSINDRIIIQTAINQSISGKIFLPRGIYYIDAPLELKENTQLFGVGKVHSIIEPLPGSVDLVTDFLITTVNDSEAMSSISSLMLRKNLQTHPRIGFLQWRVGRQSIVNGLMLAGQSFLSEQDADNLGFTANRFFEITGSGGGRWYAIAAEWQRLKPTTKSPEFRVLKVENTTQPLTLYGLNAERSFSDAQIEFKNASNIHVYHYKVEAGAPSGPNDEYSEKSIPLLIDNSNGVEVHTVFGQVQDMEKPVNSGNFLPITKIINQNDNCITISSSSSQWNHSNGNSFKVLETDNAVGLNAVSGFKIMSSFQSCPSIPIQKIKIEIADDIVSEPSDNGSFKISRTGNTDSSVTVRYIISGDATNGIDFQFLNGSITFAAGQLEFILPIIPIDDQDIETPENLTIQIKADYYYDIDQVFNKATVSIQDNDLVSLPIVSITSIDDQLVENPLDLGKIKINRTGNLNQDLTVYYFSNGGTAYNDQDFLELSGEIVIPAGQSEVTIDIIPVDDGIEEYQETIAIYLSNNSNYEVDITNNKTILTIIDGIGNLCGQVENYNFKNDISGYDMYIHQDADAIASHENEQLKILISEGTDTKWKINVRQQFFTLEKNKTYQLSFKASANYSRLAYINLARYNPTFQSFFYDPLQLDTTPRYYNYEFVMGSDTDDQITLQFGLGEYDNSIVYLDDICLTEVIDCGLVHNATLNLGNEGYSSYVHQDALADWNTNNGQLEFTISEGTDTKWKVSLFQNEISLKQGRSYQVQFDVHATIDRIIHVNLANYENGFVGYSYEPINISTIPNTYTYTFTMDAADDPNARLQFGLGEYSNHTIWFDNICIQDLTCPINLVLDNSIISGNIFQANQMINSNSTMPSGSQVYFNAGKQIILDPGFNVDKGAIFETEMEGCN